MTYGDMETVLIDPFELFFINFNIFGIILFCSYFPGLSHVITDTFCVDSSTPEVVAVNADLRKSDVTIIGGGGLLDHSDRWNYALEYYCRVTTCEWRCSLPTFPPQRVYCTASIDHIVL